MSNSSSKVLSSQAVSVVVPVFNSEATLEELTSRIFTVLRPITINCEIILVNDNSRDGSWEVIKKLAEQNSDIRGIRLMRNYGQHSALLAGIIKAKYEVIVTLDDDLQHPPEEIPKLLDKLNQDYDIVYGKPDERSHDFWRNVTSWLLKVILKVALGANIAKHLSSFRAFHTNLREGFEGFTDAKLSIDVLLSWSAARVTHVMVQHDARRVGSSQYTLRRLVVLALTIMTGYSTLPLRVASAVGLLTSLFGISMFFYVVLRRLLETDYVPGFTFIASEIALFAGLQLFAIGIIGEYLARLHFRTMGKPAFVIRDTVGQSEPQTKLAMNQDDITTNKNKC